MITIFQDAEDNKPSFLSTAIWVFHKVVLKYLNVRRLYRYHAYAALNVNVIIYEYFDKIAGILDPNSVETLVVGQFIKVVRNFL